MSIKLYKPGAVIVNIPFIIKKKGNNLGKYKIKMKKYVENVK